MENEKVYKSRVYRHKLHIKNLNITLEYAKCPICGKINYFEVFDNELNREWPCNHLFRATFNRMLFKERIDK
jgi:hypothetical protein